MEFSTEAVQKMAEIMVSEMGKIGLGGKGIRDVETGMREFLRAVGNEALGKYLEQKDEEERVSEICVCGEEMKYLFKRAGTIISVFGRVSYRRRYCVCPQCHTGVSPLDR